MQTTTTPETLLDIPAGSELIDECFYVWNTRFDLYSTMTKEGRLMMTGGTRDGVVDMTRWHLKCEQEGWPEGSVHVVNNGIVSGKL